MDEQFEQKNHSSNFSMLILFLILAALYHFDEIILFPICIALYLLLYCLFISLFSLVTYITVRF